MSRSGQTEICDFEFPVFHEDIFGFHVSMNDALPNQFVESGEDHGHVLDCLRLGDGLLLSEKFAQVALIAELLDDIVVVGCFDDVSEADDVL